MSCGGEEGRRTWVTYAQFPLCLLLKIRPQRRLGLEAILGINWSSNYLRDEENEVQRDNNLDVQNKQG